jgi:ketosteroid isomerase-like protein
MNNEKEEALIKDLLARQAVAIRVKDLEAATKNYASDVVIYDVVGPLGQPKGVESVRDRLQQWLSSFDPASDVGFELVDISITAGEGLAFSRSFNHVTAPLKNGGSLEMFWRETLNWQKRDGDWKIVHAHSSVPFDAATGKASTGLKP